MKGHYYKHYCKCPKNKRCTCKAKWYYVIDIGIDPKTGKRKQKRKGGFSTKKEAEIAAANIIKELNEGTFIKESDITFKAFSEQWIEMYEASGIVKVSTVRVRKHEVKRLMDYFAKLKLKDITLKRYQDALLDLKKRGFAENTISGAHRTGRMIFKKAVELGLIKKDPTEFAVLPREQKTVEELESRKDVPKYLERDELLRLLDTARKHGLDRDYPMFLTLAYTGMRIGELAALKWSDIDFDEQLISITKTYYNPTNNAKAYQLLTPKTISSIRTIDVDDYVLSELKKLRAWQNEIRMKYRDTYHDENFVFAKLSNKRLLGYPENLKMIRLRMTRLLRLAGLDQTLSPHSLRHTHTSLLAEAGATLEEIMERLGHVDDQTTRNVYLHITKRRKKEVSQKFAKLMRNP